MMSFVEPVGVAQNQSRPRPPVSTSWAMSSVMVVALSLYCALGPTPARIVESGVGRAGAGGDPAAGGASSAAVLAPWGVLPAIGMSSPRPPLNVPPPAPPIRRLRRRRRRHPDRRQDALR